VLILVLARSCIDSAFTPARVSAVRAIADDGQLDGANGFVHALSQLSKVLGPALGGLLLLFVTPQVIFGLNASLSLIAVAILWGISIPPAQRDKEERHSILLEAPSGFAEFLRNRTLRYALMFMALGFFAIFLYDTFIALLAVDFGFDSAIYGFSVALAGAGGVLGALLAAGLSFGNWHLRVMAIGGAVSGSLTFLLGALAVLGAALMPVLFLGIFFVIGFAMSFIYVPYRSLIQRETPSDRTARVFAAGEAVTMLALLTAPFAGGFLAQTFGNGTPFAIGGALLVLVSISAFGVGARTRTAGETLPQVDGNADDH
jgi:predicted MFS family arabinose efflux permease